MTRKDYVLIAKVLADSKTAFQPQSPAAAAQHREIVHRMADALLNANTNFNRSRFLTAAGGL